MNEVSFGLLPYQIRAAGQSLFHGQTVSGLDSVGVAARWAVTSADFDLSILDVKWRNDERDIRAADVTRARLAIQHLNKGQRRIGVYATSSGVWVGLRMAKIKLDNPTEWTTAVTASLSEWADLHGRNWHSALGDAFGLRIGTKADLLGQNGKTRNDLCALIPNVHADEALPHLFVLTRVVPLARGATV